MPVAYADLQNPQSLNLYDYVGNNPLSRNDPDGHLWEELKNLWKWNHYVNDAGLEAALQKEADQARHDISGMHNLSINGKSPADAVKDLNNQQTLTLDRNLTEYFRSKML